MQACCHLCCLNCERVPSSQGCAKGCSSWGTVSNSMKSMSAPCSMHEFNPIPQKHECCQPVSKLSFDLFTNLCCHLI